MTQRTKAAFEPALDYCVVKIPRWPFDKFPTGDRTLGTAMKATGEVMSIDRSFEAALQKAVRSLEMGGRSLLWEDPEWRTLQGWEELPILPATDLRLWALMAALRRGGYAGGAGPSLLRRPLVHPCVGAPGAHGGGPARHGGHHARPHVGSQAPGFADEQLAALGVPTASPSGRGSSALLGASAPCTRWWTPARRVRGRHALLLQHLRAGERGAPASWAQGRGRGQRPHSHRPGH